MNDALKQYLLAELVKPQYATLNDADAAAAVPTHVAKPGPVYVTYVYIGTLAALLGPAAGNIAGSMHDGLAAWCAAPDLSVSNPSLPNPGQLAIIHARLSGSLGVDLTDPTAPGLLSLFASGIDAQHPPLLSADQSAALLTLGYDVYGPTAQDVTDVRAILALNAAKDARMTAVETWASYARNAVDTAASINALPAVPEVPQS